MGWSEVSDKRPEGLKPVSEAEKKGVTSGHCSPAISYGNACGLVWSVGTAPTSLECEARAE